MTKLTGKFHFWDKVKRIAVCPLNAAYDSDRWGKLIADLTAIKCEVVGEIDMPIDFGYRFLVVRVPDWLDAEEDDEVSNLFVFTDPKGSHRFRINASGTLMHTVVFTRYWPSDCNFRAEFLPCVYDLEAEDADTDEPEPLWMGAMREDDDKRTLDDLKSEAEAWLDKEYPHWRDPMAYWS